MPRQFSPVGNDPTVALKFIENAELLCPSVSRPEVPQMFALIVDHSETCRCKLVSRVQLVAP